jgi:hypothetical protein
MWTDSFGQNLTRTKRKVTCRPGRTMTFTFYFLSRCTCVRGREERVRGVTTHGCLCAFASVRLCECMCVCTYARERVRIWACPQTTVWVYVCMRARGRVGVWARERGLPCGCMNACAQPRVCMCVCARMRDCGGVCVRARLEGMFVFMIAIHLYLTLCILESNKDKFKYRNCSLLLWKPRINICSLFHAWIQVQVNFLPCCFPVLRHQSHDHSEYCYTKQSFGYMLI